MCMIVAAFHVSGLGLKQSESSPKMPVESKIAERRACIPQGYQITLKGSHVARCRACSAWGIYSVPPPKEELRSSPWISAHHT